MRPDILTVEGTYFDFTKPEDHTFKIETIAHALAHICRFNGHTSQHYSVAQHSILVSQIVPPAYALHGLLHDAAEAYCGDVTAPLKQLLPDYKTIEKRVEAALLKAFGLPAEMPYEVKYADLVALATEQRDLMPAHDDSWTSIAGVKPLTQFIRPWSQHHARFMFLQRFEELTCR